MKKIIFPPLFRAFVFCFLIVFLVHTPVVSGKSNSASIEATPADDSGWVTMPAGGKPAYMGIHGGTMPVSLLVSRDGSSLFSFVGRTGNDFLNALRKAYLPLPSLGNATRDSGDAFDFTPARTGLFAGNATATMPVISLSGVVLSNPAWLTHLQPFGLSEEPLSIEGQVMMPKALTPAKKFRNFFLPNYFQPEKK